MSRWQLWLVCAAACCSFITISMIEPLVPLYSLALGATPIVIGALVSTGYLLPVFLAVPAGKLVDRWGPRLMLIAGTLGFLVAPSGVALVPGLATLVIAQVLAGLSQLLVVLAAQSAVALLGEQRHQREYNFGWYSSFVSAGQLIGPLLAGTLADLSGYRAAFLGAGLVSLISLALLQKFDPGERRTSPALERGRAPAESPVKALLSDRGLQIAVIASAGTVLAHGVHRTFLPPYLQQFQYPATVIGLLFSLRALVGFLIRPFMPSIAQRLGGRTRTLILVTLATGLGLMANGVTQRLSLLVAAALLIGVGTGLAQPLTMVAMTENVPEQVRGFALGVRLTINRLAQFLNPLLFGAIAEWAGIEPAFLAAGGLMVFSGWIMARLRPPLAAGSRGAGVGLER